MFNAYNNNPYSSYNPYINSYTTPSSLSQIQQMQQQIPLQTAQTNSQNNNLFSGSIVSSYDEVRNFAIPASGSVMLLDLGNKRFYIKGMGENGIPQIQAFAFDSVMSDRPASVENKEDSESILKLNSLEERVNILEEMLKGQEVLTRKNTTKKEG